MTPTNEGIRDHVAFGSKKDDSDPYSHVGRPFSSVLEAQSKYISQAFDVGLDTTSVQ